MNFQHLSGIILTSPYRQGILNIKKRTYVLYRSRTMRPVYLCIDLKSYYASVECVERGLNPLTTNLVVADTSRSEKTICLAVSPSLKSYGLSGRSRLLEVEQKLKQVRMLTLLIPLFSSFSTTFLFFLNKS